MQNKLLYVLWGVLFIICAGLGFMPDAAYPAAAVLFFLPPAVLLYRAKKLQDLACIRLICLLSALSLGATLLLLVGNVLSVAASETIGTLLYYLLVILSAPMVCSGYWVLSLFLWACLLVAARKLLPRK